MICEVAKLHQCSTICQKMNMGGQRSTKMFAFDHLQKSIQDLPGVSSVINPPHNVQGTWASISRLQEPWFHTPCDEWIHAITIESMLRTRYRNRKSQDQWKINWWSKDLAQLIPTKPNKNKQILKKQNILYLVEIIAQKKHSYAFLNNYTVQLYKKLSTPREW